jgi:6-pyruvoyltetrahydropterin/6-carboxytetrahydropterin synthase
VTGGTEVKVGLTRAVEFSSSLRIARADLSEAENELRFGREARSHGYNYRLEVTIRGEPDPLTGMVLDLKELKDLLEREIVLRFDHKDLNADTPFFEKAPPTPENLALVIRRLLLAALPAGMLARIRLSPEPDLFVEVIEPEPSA